MALTRQQQKAIFARLNKKTNRELNEILNFQFTTPDETKTIEEIFDKRMEADPEFQKHIREQQAELIKKKIAGKI